MKVEIDFAKNLHAKGKSFGEITKLLHREFGVSWDISTVEHAIKKQNKSSSKKRMRIGELLPHSTIISIVASLGGKGGFLIQRVLLPEQLAEYGHHPQHRLCMI